MLLGVPIPEGSAESFGVGPNDIKKSDLDYSFYRSSGPGGQHKNKTHSAVRLRHVPTGIVVHAQFGRSQTKNKETALKILAGRLSILGNKEIRDKRNEKRRKQVGRGTREDKIRTYSVKKDLVVDHRTGRRMSFSRFVKGFIKDIY